MIEESFWKWILRGLKRSFIGFFKFSWIFHPVFQLVFGAFLGTTGSVLVWYYSKIPWLVIPCIVGGVLLCAHGAWGINKWDRKEGS